MKDSFTSVQKIAAVGIAATTVAVTPMAFADTASPAADIADSHRAERNIAANDREAKTDLKKQSETELQAAEAAETAAKSEVEKAAHVAEEKSKAVADTEKVLSAAQDAANKEQEGLLAAMGRQVDLERAIKANKDEARVLAQKIYDLAAQLEALPAPTEQELAAANNAISAEKKLAESILSEKNLAEQKLSQEKEAESQAVQDLVKAKAKVDALNRAKNEIDEIVKEKDATLKAKRAELQHLKDTQEARKQELKTQLAALEEEWKTVNASVNEANRALLQARDTKNAAQQSLDAAKGQSAQALQQKQSKTEKLAQKRSELASAVELEKIARDEVAKSDAAKNQKKAERDQLQEELQRVQKERNELKAKPGENQEKLAKVEAAFDQISKKYEALTQEYQLLKDAHYQHQQRAEKAKAQVTQLQKTVQEAEKELAQAESELQRKVELQRKAEAELQKREQEFTEKANAAIKLEERQQDFANRHKALAQEKNDLESGKTLAAAEEAVKVADKEKDIAIDKQYKFVLPAFKTELKNANDAKQEAELKVVAAQGKVAAAQQKLNDLIARADSQQRALDEAEKTLAKFQERQKAYEAKLAEKKSAAKMLGELRAVDAKLNSQLQSIQEQVLKAQEAVRKAKANLVQQQQSVSAALAQLDQARKLVASKQLTLAQRKAEVAKAKAKFALYHQQQKVVSSVADGKHLAGSKFKVMFSGFSPYSRNKVILASTPVELGVFEADAAGNFTVEVTTPFEAGAHSVTATNAWGDWARYEFNVNESKPMIPLQPAKPMIPMLGGKSELAQPKMQQPMGEAQKMLAQTGYDVISLGVMTAASVVTGAALLVSRRRGKHSI